MSLLTAPIFGTKHIIAIVYVIILIAVLFYTNKEKSYEANKKMILKLSIAFITLEIIKLSFLIIRDSSFPMNHLPFHLCSLPLYLYPILYFSKENSKLENFVKPAAYASVLAATLAALILPTNIIGSNDAWIPFTDNFFPLLSFTYHGLMLFAPIYMLRNKYYIITNKDIPKALAVTSVLMIFALIANFFLDRDFMLLNTGNGSPLVFLLDYGQLVYTLSMIGLGLIVVSLMGFGFGGMLYFVYLIIADVIDEDELKTGVRHEGIFFGITNFFMRLSMVLSILTVGLVFTASGWGDYQPSPGVDEIFGLRLLVFLFPAIALGLNLICLKFYPFSKSRVEEIKQQITELHNQKKEKVT